MLERMKRILFDGQEEPGGKAGPGKKGRPRKDEEFSESHEWHE